MDKYELEGNRRGLRVRWAWVWLVILGSVCLGVYLGIFIGCKVFGG